MKTCYDAAVPPATAPVTDVVLIYCGGDTPHVWTDEEIAAQPARYRLPCWVRSDPGQADAGADAQAFVTWLEAHHVPKLATVVLDLETAVDVAYVEAFGTELHAAGYKVIVYGSIGDAPPNTGVFLNPRLDGYFTAHPGATIIDSQPGVVATQFAYDLDGGAYDLSWIVDDVPLWEPAAAPAPPVPVPPPAPPVPPVPPAPPAPPEGGLGFVLRTLKVVNPSNAAESLTGGDVKSVQELLNAKDGAGLKVDGVYWNATAGAVRNWQARHELNVDGVVGTPQTWPSLIEA